MSRVYRYTYKRNTMPYTPVPFSVTITASTKKALEEGKKMMWEKLSKWQIKGGDIFNKSFKQTKEEDIILYQTLKSIPLLWGKRRNKCSKQIPKK